MAKNIVNSQTLANFFRRDIRTIQLWAKAGLPREGRDRFDFVASVDWRIKQLEKENEELRGVGGVLKSSKERKENANAQLLELELAELKKELMRVDEAVQMIDKIINTIKTKLPTSRKTIIPKLLLAKDDKQVIKILETRDSYILNELSATFENIIGGMAQSSDQNYTAPRSDKTARGRTS